MAMGFSLVRVQRLRRRDERQAPPVRDRFVRYVLPLAFLLGLITVVPVWLFFSSLVGAWHYFGDELPATDLIASRPAPGSTLLYDRNGKFLYEIFDPQYGRRQHVDLDAVAPTLIQATIATEDHDFYQNSGINLRGITRALYNNLTSDEEEGLQGGSSITQQLVKNVLIAEEERTVRSPSRKVKEVLLAYALTRRYDKDQILEWYLNEIYYGNLSYGIQAASQSYFGKDAKDLDLAESAMLAGLPQAPARYSPLTDPKMAAGRQRDVLDVMVKQGMISQEEADAAAQQKLQYQPARFPINAPHFVMYVRDLLERKYGAQGLYRQNLKITTTLDLDFNNQVEKLLKDRMRINRGYGASNGAAVTVEPKTGEILAMVGSADYYDSKIQGQVNMATAPRQPGSSFKPYVYVTAFMKGWNPSTTILDAPITIGNWSPHNYSGGSSGPMQIRRALGNSLNIPAVRAIVYAGVENTIATAHRMGITSLNLPASFYGPPVALGAGDIALLDHTFGFATFANNGVQIGQELPPDLRKPGFREVEPAAILKIEDMSGNVLEEYTPSEREVVPAKYAYMITHILKENANRVHVFGPNAAINIPERPTAAKTGTSEHNRDNLAMGYTPDLAVGVWMGNNNGRPMSGSADGVTTAAPLWRSIMLLYHKGKPVHQFVRPPGSIPGVDDREPDPNDPNRPQPQPKPKPVKPKNRPQARQSQENSAVIPRPADLIEQPRRPRRNARPRDTVRPLPVPDQTLRPAPTPSPSPKRRRSGPSFEVVPFDFGGLTPQRPSR